MGYKYGTSSGVSFSGAVITENEPLKSVWATDAPSWQFIQFTPMSPAQSPKVQYYPGLELNVLVHVVFEAYGIELIRLPIRQRRLIVSIPEEVMATARSMFNDAGGVPETIETFAIKLYAPIGVGVYWLPRSVVWGFT